LGGFKAKQNPKQSKKQNFIWLFDVELKWSINTVPFCST